MRGWKGFDLYAILALIALVASLFVGGILVYFSWRGPLSPLETTLFSILQLILGILASWYLGSKQTAGAVEAAVRGEREPFIRSALRRISTIRRGLESLQVTVRESFKRMITAVDEERGLDIDSVEQLLNIVHVQLAGHIQEVQDRIEDWKEWFPEEMESIIEREEHIHGEITEVQERISEIVRAIGQAAPSERVSELEVQLETLATRLAELEGLRQLSSYAPVSPRRLVAEGRFTEAIEEYNERIANRPRLHTLYIGRARARAAAGDVRGALADLDHAESLCPDDEAIARVRLSIEADTEEVSPVSWHRIFPILFEGNARLQEGNFQDALQCYEQAQQRGLYTPQALVNKAMAHCLGGDYDTAMCLLDEAIEVVRGPFNEVEICAVRLVCSLLAGREDDEARINLQDALERAERVAPFKLSRSPPRFFQEGLRAVEQYTPEVDNMFQLLES